MFHVTDDLHIAKVRPLISPAILMEELPLTEGISETISNARTAAASIMKGIDDRLLVIVGPCSIHDPDSAIEYAQKLLLLRETLCDDLEIVMRVYFEKPRTTVGWKGLINDPDLDGSFKINQGLRIARQLLVDLGAMGLPVGTEFLDTISPQFVADLVSWGAIGARTTESQVHRELASGLSVPVGFKNGTDGRLQIAIDAIGAALGEHSFLSVTKQGLSAIVSTTGNADCHVILRGGSSSPNYDETSVKAAAADLEAAELPAHVMVDCSHGNSRKNHLLQVEVCDELCRQIAKGDAVSSIVTGVMIESHLFEGRQNLVAGTKLEYGKSMTDACLSWEQTVPLLHNLSRAASERRARRSESA